MDTKLIILCYSLTFLLGFLWGLSELLSRYREIKLILYSRNALLYLFINGMASVLVYYFIPKLNISFGVFTQNEWGKIILAGLSAMFILRSSFFSYHDKDSNKAINVGISTILQVFLDSAERSFDREHSTNKLKQVSLVMKDIDFTKAEKNLSVICLNLMLNVSTEEQKKLGESVKNLSQDMDPLAKSIALGIILEQVTGVELLKQAVECLGLSIKITPEKIDVFQQLGQLEKNLK